MLLRLSFIALCSPSDVFWTFLRVDKVHGQTLEVNDLTRLAYTKPEPIGVW